MTGFFLNAGQLAATANADTMKIAENAKDTLATGPEKLAAGIEKLSSLSFEDIITQLLDNAVKFGLHILAAIVIYVIGAWIIKRINKMTRSVFTRRKIDPSLASFLNSFISISLTVILIIITISALGVNTTSFAALLAASGVAIGMAMSGTLQNFAGGVMLLLFKPFKVGDFIDAQSYSGTVKAINITTTSITTPDNKLIIIPNGNLVNGIINNYSSMGIRRCDWKIGISYGDDTDVAKKTILDLLDSDPRVLKEPAKPFAAVNSLDDSAVTLVARAWVKSEDYWGLFYDINEKIYKEIPKAGLSFPFPQMDVHVKNEQ